MLANRNSSTTKKVQSLLSLVENSMNTAIRVEGAVIWGAIAMNIARLDLFKSYGGLALARGFLNLFIKETRVGRYMGIRGEAAEGLMEIKREEKCSANYGTLLKILGLIKDSTVFAGTWFFKGAVASEIFVAVSITNLLLTAGKGIYKYKTDGLKAEDIINIAIDSLSALGTISILWNPYDGFGKAIAQAKEGNVSTYYKATSLATTVNDAIGSAADLRRTGQSAIAVKKAFQSSAEDLEQAERDLLSEHNDLAAIPMYQSTAFRGGG